MHWRLSAERDSIFVETYGCTPLPEPSKKVINYEKLTKEKVVIWLESIMGVIPEPIDEVTQLSQLETIKQSLENSIDEKLEPISERVISTF